ncbi:MAG: hypothetical protein ACPLZC_06090 [Candidatus Bathyarchaeales archaeon]
MSDDKPSEQKCAHAEDDLEFLGEQKCEGGMNRYYRCLKCGSVIIVSRDGFLYEVPAAKK